MIISAGDFLWVGRPCLVIFIVGSWCTALSFVRTQVEAKVSLLSYITMLLYCGGGIVCHRNLSWVFIVGLSFEDVVVSLGSCYFPQIIGHSSYNWSLKYFSAGFVAVALLGEPVMSPILAYFILGETIMPVTIFGGSLVLAGIAGCTWRAQINYRNISLFNLNKRGRHLRLAL